MNYDTYNHATKLLIEKREEFEKEIEFVDDEIKTLKNTYIRENALYILYEVVKHIPDDKYYNVLSVKVNKQGEIIYDIGEIYTSNEKLLDKIHVIDVNEYKIIKG